MSTGSTAVNKGTSEMAQQVAMLIAIIICLIILVVRVVYRKIPRYKNTDIPHFGYVLRFVFQIVDVFGDIFVCEWMYKNNDFIDVFGIVMCCVFVVVYLFQVYQI